MKLLYAALLLFATESYAEVRVPNPPKPGVEWVVDEARLLDEQSLSSLNASLKQFEKDHKAVVTVLTIKSLDGNAIEDFGIRVAEAWKIGDQKRDDGIILMVAEKERRLRLEVGYGLEGVVTDAMSKRILGEIVGPTIRTSGFSAGIFAGVDALKTLIANGSLDTSTDGSGSDSVESSESDSGENKLKIPKTMWLGTLIGSVPVILLLGLAGLFQSQIAYFLIGIFICGIGGYMVSLMTKQDYGMISGGVSFFLYILLRQIVVRTAWGQRTLAASGSEDAREESSSTSASTSSSNSSDTSSRGGGFGGGGASDNF